MSDDKIISCVESPYCSYGNLMDKKYRQIKGDVLFGENPEIFVVVESLLAHEVDAKKVFTTKPPREQDLSEYYVPNNALYYFLDKFRINRVPVYLTSCIKCLPFAGSIANIKPTRSDIKKCNVHFLQELKKYKPKGIILCGSETYSLFNIQGKPTTIRGEVIKKKHPMWEDGPEFYIIPTLSPRFFYWNYSNSVFESVRGDFNKLYKLLQGEEPVNCIKNLDYQLLDTEQKVISFVDQMLERNQPLAFDTETTGLRKNSAILCYSFSWGKDQAAILPIYRNNLPEHASAKEIDNLQLEEVFSHEFLYQQLKRLLCSDFPKIGHNIKFDYNVTANNFGFEVQGKLLDTIIFHHLLNEAPPHDLEFLLDVEFGYGKYSKELFKFVGTNKDKRHYGYIPDSILWRYSAIDAEGTYRLATEVLLPEISRHPHFIKLYWYESHKLIRSLAKAERFGHKIDRNIFLELKKEYEEKADSILVELKKLTFPEFNPNSVVHRTKAVKMFLADKNKADLYKICVSGNKISTSEDILSQLRDENDEFATKMLEYRKYKKILGTYIEKTLSEVDHDEMIQLNWNITGTKSGRLSCSLGHQIPKIEEQRYKEGKPVLRQGFIAPPGYKYIYMDASQIELRVFAKISNDKKFLGLLERGEDIHKITCSAFLGIPPEKVNAFNRTEVGKRVNFAIIYGSSGYSLLKQGKWMDEQGNIHPFTRKMVQDGMFRWQQMFPSLGEFLEQVVIELELNNGTVKNPYGRERRFKELFFNDSYKLKSQAVREATNFKIQSSAASVTYRVVNTLHQILESQIQKGKLNNFDIVLVNTVHDSLAYVCKNEHLDWFLKTVKKVTSIPDPVLQHVFPYDIGIGDNWAEAELNSKG